MTEELQGHSRTDLKQKGCMAFAILNRVSPNRSLANTNLEWTLSMNTVSTNISFSSRLPNFGAAVRFTNFARVIHMFKSALRLCICVAALGFAQFSHAWQWQPPIGIPAPDFGIDDSHMMYTGLPGYSDAGNGPYTHYVDNSAGCTDSGNANGSPGNPRCTVPGTLAAGSVVEIHGGPYSGSGTLQWRINGTANQPVFIRGIGPSNKPVFLGEQIELTGSYGIVEYIDADQTDIEWPGPSDHLTLRHSHVHDHPGTGAVVDNSHGTYTVVYNNEINNHGVIPSAKDRHGVFTGGNTDQVWIVDNHIHHNSGDAIQFCHGCVGVGNGPRRVYIGRNLMHEDEENAIDLKEFIGPVIISENIIHSYATGPFSGSGEAIRINDEGSQGDVWLLYNEIFNANSAIQPDDSNAAVYVIGNVMHDINDLTLGSDADFVINNTIYNAAVAMGNVGEVRDNIIFNASGSAIQSVTGGCSHNLVSNSGSAPASCSNTVTGDPQLTFDTNNRLVGVQQSSPAVGAASSNHAVYQTFQSQFGLNIRLDANGNARPAGVSWTIGAHEPGAGAPQVRPMAPSSLSID